MTPQQLLLILKARYKIVLVALFVIVATTLGINLLLPARYSANVDIVIDVKSPDPVAGVIFPAVTMPGYMATQIDIINSRRVAQRVIKLLKIDTNPVILQDWRDQTEGKGDFIDWLALRLKSALKVQPSRESNLITITYTASNPEFAAAMANAYAKAYIDTTVELRVEPASQNAGWFKDKSAALRADLEKAQAKLSVYQNEKGIVVTDDRLDYEIQRLNDLSSQLTQAQGQTADAQSRSTGQSDTVVDVMSNGVVQGLKADIARQEAQLQDVAGNLGVNHPQYQRLHAQLAALRQQLNLETAKINASIATANSVSRSKESEIRSTLEAQKLKVLKMRQARDEAAVLVREVESAQKAFDAVTARLTQTSLESQTSLTNIAILTPAVVPATPSSPRVLFNTLAAAVLGTFMGLALAALAEFKNRRIRSIRDLDGIAGIPVLVQMHREERLGPEGWFRLGKPKRLAIA